MTTRVCHWVIQIYRFRNESAPQSETTGPTLLFVRVHVLADIILPNPFAHFLAGAIIAMPNFSAATVQIQEFSVGFMRLAKFTPHYCVPFGEELAPRFICLSGPQDSALREYLAGGSVVPA